MRYNPNAYVDYPILRPNSSDYPDGGITTSLEWARENTNLLARLEFNITEPGILKQIKKADAICFAFLYCSTTCYSEMLRADSGSTVISALIPLSNLKGRVELHPSVVAVDDLVLRTDTAHPEYKSQSIPVQFRKQIAVDEPWHFSVGLVGKIESVFRLEQSEEQNSLEDGEFDFQIDPTSRYIVIRSNPRTYRDFQRIRERGQKPLTAASVYLSALTAALGELEPEPDDSEPAEGWAHTVRALLQKHNLPWPDGCSDGLAAQRLMRTPLAALPNLSEQMLRGDGL